MYKKADEKNATKRFFSDYLEPLLDSKRAYGSKRWKSCLDTELPPMNLDSVNPKKVGVAAFGDEFYTHRNRLVVAQGPKNSELKKSWNRFERKRWGPLGMFAIEHDDDDFGHDPDIDDDDDDSDDSDSDDDSDTSSGSSSGEYVMAENSEPETIKIGDDRVEVLATDEDDEAGGATTSTKQQAAAHHHATEPALGDTQQPDRPDELTIDGDDLE
eukprot:CAMPEP_0197542112 /NCGR_PEP_ID=MMETSP1318-20131121/67531_1 /TAXON_ID=552666 /ORGANISM="Partenskyella glossopodia, Strain RCC365" /LENGTH=213 /DNA_ID=CAMNT_0043101355 /DNA_START=89 /DNA_END=730 /DNA_ORIENTATION=-